MRAITVTAEVLVLSHYHVPRGWESECMVSGRKASFSSVERREIPRLFTRFFLLPILKTGTILESFQSYVLFFDFPDLQGQFLRARSEFYTTMFSDFRRYTTPSSRGSTFLCCIDWIQQFLEFMFFIKTCNVWPLCNGVQGRAISYSCYILKLVKAVCKSTKNSSFSCRTVSPSKALSRFLGNCPPTPPLS